MNGLVYKSLEELPLEAQEAVRGLYESSFPLEERRPWSLLLQPIDPRHIPLVMMNPEGEVLALISYWLFDEVLYLEHLAVDLTKRSRGLGAKALAYLDEVAAGRLLLLEVEPPLDSLSERRLGFYERAGYRLLTKEYEQPSYGNAPGLALWLLGKGPTLPIGELIRLLHCNVYRVNDKRD